MNNSYYHSDEIRFVRWIAGFGTRQNPTIFPPALLLDPQSDLVRRE